MRARISGFLLSPTESVAVQMFRYAIVGGAAFAVDFGSLAFFTEIVGLHYLISAAAAFLLGLSTNYLLSVGWVFASRSRASRTAEFAVFASIGVAGLGLNELLMWLFTGVAGFHYLLSKMGSAFFVYLWNFFARRQILFRPKEGTCPAA